MKEIELKIEGMHCTGCSNRLEKVLNNIEGVTSAQVNFDEKSAIVNFDEGKVTIEKIKENIEDAGFTAEKI